MTALLPTAGGLSGEFEEPPLGPPSAAGLDADPDSFAGETAHAGMVAAFHAKNRAAWQQYRWLLSACRSRAGTTTRRLDDPRAPQAAAAAFGWSSMMASAKYDFARDILERLPAIGEAMREGWLEEQKASNIASTVRDLDDAEARLVVARVLGQAPELSHRALTTLTEKTAADVDPGWDEARRAAAIARARVLARIAPSGAAELSGLDLPVEPAVEAHGHIVAVADAVRAAVRARGRDLTVGTVQSHVFVRLLHHDLLGADDATLAETLTDELASAPPDDDHPGEPDGPDDDGPDDDEGDDDLPPDGPSDPTDEPGPDDSRNAGDEPAEGPDDSGARDTGALAFRSGLAVRLGLTTLLGRDRQPGELPDWGVVAASTARRLARARRDASWRVIIYDPGGQFDQVLTVRPPGERSVPGEPHRRQVVELTATRAMIDALDPVEHLGFEADLVRQARAALAAARARAPEDHPAVTANDARRRHPGAELDRHVRGRDRCCRFRGCTRPAMGSDLDHTVDWQDDGLTLAGNLGALCRYHHRLKHDADSGWSVTQPTPGRFEWISPQGARHIVEPPVEHDLAASPARADGGFSVPSDAFVPRPAEPWAPRRNHHGYLTDAARSTAGDVARQLRAVADEPPSRYDTDPDF
ncbi:HNH endonuclease signature motif containing protein [Actinomycetospora sp.]|jgi:hypothetical protein|uniref:HNH endonuclease signature motif containing protein n=1 Tax=Actinomycetospora sp. TaxID=1872135 RepID=UPI002F4250C8